MRLAGKPSEASTERGTRAPLQSPVSRSQSPLSTPSMCRTVASRHQPWGSPRCSPGLPHGRRVSQGGPSFLPLTPPWRGSSSSPAAAPLPTVLASPPRSPSPRLPRAPGVNGVSRYLGHRRRWSAPRWPSRRPRGSRRTWAGDPWRCRSRTGGRGGARSLREPLAAGVCPRSAGPSVRPLREKNPSSPL